MIKPGFVVLTVCLMAVTALGCGGGGSAQDQTIAANASLTKAAFVKQATAICDRGKARMVGEFQSYQQRAKQPVSATDPGIEVIETIFIPRLSEQLEEIRALGAPPKDRAQIETYLVGTREALEQVEDRKLSANKDLLTTFKSAGAIALDLGIKPCAYGY